MAKKKTQPRALADFGWHETDVQIWPGLFKFFKAHGVAYAELSDRLYNRSCSILCGTSPIVGHPKYWGVRCAAKMASFGARGQCPSVINDLFKWVSDAQSRPERERRAEEAKEILCTILDEFAGTNQVKPHGSKQTVVMDGNEKPVPLAYAAIEHARQLVEIRQRLPTKIEVQRSMEDAFPDLIHLSKSAWPKVWKEAGLVTLPMGEYGTGNVPLGSRK